MHFSPIQISIACLTGQTFAEHLLHLTWISVFLKNIWYGKNASILTCQELLLKLQVNNSHFEIYKRWGQLTI